MRYRENMQKRFSWKKKAWESCSRDILTSSVNFSAITSQLWPKFKRNAETKVNRWMRSVSLVFKPLKMRKLNNTKHLPRKWRNRLRLLRVESDWWSPSLETSKLHRKALPERQRKRWERENKNSTSKSKLSEKKSSNLRNAIKNWPMNKRNVTQKKS